MMCYSSALFFSIKKAFWNICEVSVSFEITSIILFERFCYFVQNVNILRVCMQRLTKCNFYVMIMFELSKIAYDIHRCPQCTEMLKQLKFAAQMTDNPIAKTLYYTLTLEALLVGGMSFKSLLTKKIQSYPNIVIIFRQQFKFLSNNFTGRSSKLWMVV